MEIGLRARCKHRRQSRQKARRTAEKPAGPGSGRARLYMVHKGAPSNRTHNRHQAPRQQPTKQPATRAVGDKMRSLLQAETWAATSRLLGITWAPAATASQGCSTDTTWRR
eukprot:scaffold257_cov422-Prasinococcus_capsulatus_cf.AAC.9